jgi:hypothetical protein
LATGAAPKSFGGGKKGKGGKTLEVLELVGLGRPDRH